jgi:hypothetical protein
LKSSQLERAQWVPSRADGLFERGRYLLDLRRLSVRTEGVLGAHTEQHNDCANVREYFHFSSPPEADEPADRHNDSDGEQDVAKRLLGKI